jgi:hypothetical protein
MKASVTMGTGGHSLAVAANPQAQRRLQAGVIAFFGVVALSLVVIYALQPEIYVQALGGRAMATDRHPLTATLFCAAILAFIAVIILGVLRRWRWLYWLLIVAFVASALQVPAGALELTGVLPDPFPTWYTIYRSVIAVGEVALGIWMLLAWRRWGVWAAGRRPRR